MGDQWEVTNSNTVSRDEAIKKIEEMAKSDGYKGGFKVSYDGEQIVRKADLPDQVDMSLVRISSLLNNA
jgi:hypothetical protein